jgi:hypothetical protein
MLEEDVHDMINLYKEDSDCQRHRSRILECENGQSSLRECGPILQRMIGKENNALKAYYCGGIASVMPWTSLVESDFSLINWNSNPQLKSLTGVSLESNLPCKHY